VYGEPANRGRTVSDQKGRRAMTHERSTEELEEELRVVEEDIASLRPTLEDLRRQIGQRDEGPTDLEERSLQIQQMEEQEAILGRMEERRADLRGRLGRE
jgi:TolA-binding protein